MEIISQNDLKILGAKTIKYKKFNDFRGYFTETFREFQIKDSLGFSQENFALQINEAFSYKNTLRGLHFQWNPFMGKLVRCIQGHLIDLILDIRKGSPTFGKIIAVDLKSDSNDFGEWVWVPVGCAHGTLLLEDTTIEYICTGTYNLECERAISPLSNDLDWSLCDEKLKNIFDNSISYDLKIRDRDKEAISLNEWIQLPESENFIYNEII